MPTAVSKIATPQASTMAIASACTQSRLKSRSSFRSSACMDHQLISAGASRVVFSWMRLIRPS